MLLNTASNVISQNVDQSLYRYDSALAAVFAVLQKQDPLGQQIHQPVQSFTPFVDRYPQNLKRLAQCLVPALPEHRDWLARRHIDYPAHSIVGLEDFEQLDLFVIPFDHVVTKFGFRPVDGPAFPDYRDGKLVGVCVRNTSTDQEFAAAAKWTFSNYGWFVWGWDDCDPAREVVLCEGVFDAIALRRAGHQSLAFGSAYPTPQQLAMVAKRFPWRRVCFDNDFWGWYGSYITSRCLGCGVLLPRGKDAAEQVFERGDLSLDEVDSERLVGLVLKNLSEYNSAAAAGRLIRALPYNR